MLDQIENIIKLLNDCSWFDEALTLRDFKEKFIKIRAENWIYMSSQKDVNINIHDGKAK